MEDKKKSKLNKHSPLSGAQIFARAVSHAFNDAPWISKELKLRFCLGFLENLLEKDWDSQTAHQLRKRFEKLTMETGFRLLRRFPDKGIEMLVTLLMVELRDRQKFTQEQLIEFHSELLEHFFPEVK